MRLPWLVIGGQGLAAMGSTSAVVAASYATVRHAFSPDIYIYTPQILDINVEQVMLASDIAVRHACESGLP